MEDTFLLAYDIQDTHNPDLATPLSPKSTQTLYEMDMPTHPKKCYLFLRDGSEGPPVKASASEGVGLASSISAATSSPAVNNASNNPLPSSSSSTNTNTWSSTTTHYSNKSETGRWRAC